MSEGNGQTEISTGTTPTEATTNLKPEEVAADSETFLKNLIQTTHESGNEGTSQALQIIFDKAREKLEDIKRTAYNISWPLAAGLSLKMIGLDRLWESPINTVVGLGGTFAAMFLVSRAAYKLSGAVFKEGVFSKAVGTANDRLQLLAQTGIGIEPETTDTTVTAQPIGE